MVLPPPHFSIKVWRGSKNSDRERVVKAFFLPKLSTEKNSRTFYTQSCNVTKDLLDVSIVFSVTANFFLTFSYILENGQTYMIFAVVSPQDFYCMFVHFSKLCMRGI